MLLDRLARMDQLIFMPSAAAANDDQAQPTNDQPLIQPEIQTTSESSTTIRYGQFKLSRDQWNQLGLAIYHNHGRIIRSIIPPGIFTNLTANYPQLLMEFKRLDWIDDQNGLTLAGCEWFNRFIPLPGPDSGQGQLNRPTTTTEGSDDTAAAAENWLNQRNRGNPK